MFVLASRVKNLGIISLQTGTLVGTLGSAVINPGNLQIVGYLCTTPKQTQPLMLMIKDVRQLAIDCVIIDSVEELGEAADIVRIQPLLAEHFDPISKTVATELGRRLGKVEDYTIDLDTFKIQKLYVQQPVWRSWFGASLIIDRSQIIDISPKQITVRDTLTKASALAKPALTEL